MGNIMGKLGAWIVVMTLVSAPTGLIASQLRLTSIEHALSLMQRPDGNFDVTCLDGTTETKSPADVLANRLCTHLRTYNGRWTLIEGGNAGGQRLCDLNLKFIRSRDMIVKLRAQFESPCSTAPVESQQCQDLSCSLPLGGKFFSFDFAVPGQLTLTQLDDWSTAVYRGNGGGVTARLHTLNGIPNILQTRNVDDMNWASVCDDSFDQVDARVACRELGFSGNVLSLNMGVLVRSDSSYGLDDVNCTGDELSLAECRHNRWGQHDCSDSEHVQLACEP